MYLAVGCYPFLIQKILHLTLRGLPQLKNIQMKKNNKGYFLIGEANVQPYVITSAVNLDKV